MSLTSCLSGSARQHVSEHDYSSNAGHLCRCSSTMVMMAMMMMMMMMMMMATIMIGKCHQYLHRNYADNMGKTATTSVYLTDYTVSFASTAT